MTDNTNGSDDAAEGQATWRTAANVLGVLLLIALVLPFVIYAAPQVAGADQSYVVLSGSMEPAFSPGDVIVVEEAPARAISEGDVITFARNGEDRPTTHRVIEVVQTEQGVAFRTKGDANEDPDPALVSPDQVRGEVMTVRGHLFVIPYLGHVIQFAGTTNGFLALVVGPLALLVLSEAYVMVRDSRRDDAGDDGVSDPDGGERQGDADEDTDGSGLVAGSAGAAPDGTAPFTATGATARTERERADAGDGTEEEGIDSGTDGTDADEDGGITLTPMDLRLTVGVLTLFVAYTVWVAYTTREVWSITAATTAGATLVLVGGMYLFGGSPPEEEPTEEPSVAAVTPTMRAPRRHEAIQDGGTERVAVSAGGTPWTGNDGTLRGGPVDSGASGEATREPSDTPPGPRPTSGSFEPAVVEITEVDPRSVPPSEELEPAIEAVPAPSPDPVPPSEELEPAVVETQSETESGRVAPEPVPPSGELRSAVTPLEATDNGATAIDGGDAGDTGTDDAGALPGGNPLISAPFLFFYYLGFLIVEPFRLASRLLPGVGGGDDDD